MKAEQRLSPVLAVVVSLGLHGLLLPPAVQWLEAAREADDEALASQTTELVVPLAEWVIVPSDGAAAEDEPSAEERAEEEAKKRLGFVRTTANQESAVAPESPDFISDRNTTAASEDVGKGDPSDPAVMGEDTETNDVEERRFRDGPLLEESPSVVAQPGTPGSVRGQPGEAAASVAAAAPRAQQVPENVVAEPLPEIAEAIPLPQPSPSPSDDMPDEPADDEQSQLGAETAPENHERPSEEPDSPPSEDAAMAGAVPGGGVPVDPAPSTVPLPDRQVPAFQSETRKSQREGGALAKNYAAFDAENSPIGRYRKEVSAAIERAWQMRMFNSREFMSFNVKIQVEFTLNRYGTVQNLRTSKRGKNAVLTNETLNAVLEADIPEMPQSVVDQLDGGDLPCQFNFRIH